MSPNVGINIRCESDCFQWCPRKSSCCSKKREDSERDIDKRSRKVARKSLDLISLEEALEMKVKKNKKVCILM